MPIRRNPMLVSFTLVAILTPTYGITDILKGDGKSYSALACTESPNAVMFPESPDPYGDNDVRYNSLGWAFNSNNSVQIVISCPIIREHIGKPMKRAWVTALNQTHKEMACEIEAFDSDGQWLEESSPFYFPPTSGDQPVTAFKSNDKDDDDAWPDNSFEWVPMLANEHGYYILQCFVPAMEKSNDGIRAAYIVKYIIDEVAN